MRKTLPFALAEIFDVEAGYQNDAADKGNWYQGKNLGTNRGITPAVLADWTGKTPTVKQMKALKATTANAILEAKFAKTIYYNDLPAGVDLALLDFAVNSGPRRAVIELQKLLGVKVDGMVGGMTIKALKRADAVSVIEKLAARRLGFMRGLGNWWKYGKGWRIRVKNVTALAVQLAVSNALIVS